MVRRLSFPLLAALTALLTADAAPAHDPDWRGQKRREDRRDPQPPPRESPEDWPDPYAHERSWGPFQLAASGGAFLPWQGDPGEQVSVNGLVSAPGGHWRLGGEFSYREFETRFFDVDDVDVESYQMTFMVHYVFAPGGPTPYLGAGLGLSVNDVSRREIERGRGDLDLEDDAGLGYHVVGVAGIELPMGDRLSLFGEGRVGLAWQITGQDDDTGDGFSDFDRRGVDRVDAEDLGGAAFLAGLRFRF